MLRYFLGLAVLFIIGCNDKDKSYTLKKLKDLKLNIETALSNVSNISYYSGNGSNYITYINIPAHSINFRNINTDSIDYAISLSNLDSIQNTEDGSACFVQNPDSIFIMLNERNTIYLIDRSGKIRSHWDVTQELENNNKDYVLQDIQPMKLSYKNGNIYIQSIRNDVVLVTPENKKIYFNTPAEVTINITQAPCKITNKTGYWPGIYKTGEGYQDFWPARCVNNKNELIYSFGINDSLFVYSNNKLTSVVEAKTQYKQNINPYPSDSNAHLVFLKKYYTTETRYKFILFNPYKDQYYRVFSKGEEIVNEDGTKIYPWSLMVLDSDFKVINETTFNSNEYNFFSILPVPEGILICRSKEQSDERNVLRYGLFSATDEK
ncbi:MAG: hypothetical protein JWO09_917 [Bacteroidetes bacterium]|nr:hypothetical protein [Bacteroidota bacterium]